MDLKTQKEYNTIISTDLNRRDLLSANDGHFEKVGALGRIWRRLKSFIMNEDAFEDCKALHVGKEIYKFAKNNAMNDVQRERLTTKISELRCKQKHSVKDEGPDLMFSRYIEDLKLNDTPYTRKF